MKPHYKYLGISRGDDYKDIVFEVSQCADEFGIKVSNDCADPFLTRAINRNGTYLYIRTDARYVLHLKRCAEPNS